MCYIYQAGTPLSGRALLELTTTIKMVHIQPYWDIQEVVNLTIMQLLNGLIYQLVVRSADDTIITSQSKNKDIKPIRKKVGLVFQFPEKSAICRDQVYIALTSKFSEFLGE